MMHDNLFLRKEIAKNNVRKVSKLSKIYVFAIPVVVLLNAISTIGHHDLAMLYYLIPLAVLLLLNGLSIFIVKKVKVKVSDQTINRVEIAILMYVYIQFISAAFVTVTSTYYMGNTIFYSLIIFSMSAFFVIKSSVYVVPVLLSSILIVVGMFIYDASATNLPFHIIYFLALGVLGYILNNTYNNFFINNVNIKAELVRENLYRKKISKDLKEANRKLMIQNTIDPLTSLQNRMSFNSYLETLKNMTTVSPVKLTAVLIDIDCFKRYNDFYGHAKGDHVISKVGNVIFEIGEKYGVFAARYGGEEFTIIMHKVSSIKVKLICEELLREVSKLKIPHLRSDVDEIITISIGAETITARKPNEVLQVIEDADKMLYEVKRNGKNAYLVSSN